MEVCLLETAALGVRGGDTGKPGCPVGAAGEQRGTGRGRRPWAPPQRVDPAVTDDSQPAASSRAPGCLPKEETAPAISRTEAMSSRSAVKPGSRPRRCSQLKEIRFLLAEKDPRL